MKRSLVLFTIPLTLGLGLLNAEEEKPAAAPDKPERPARPERPERPGGPPRGERERQHRPPMDRPKFEELDADNSGDVTEDEFVDFQVKRAAERAKEFFGRMDRNKDGKLTKEEIPAGPHQRGDRPEGRPRGEGDRRPPGAPEGRRGGKPDAPEGQGTKPKRPAAEGDAGA